MINLPNEMLQKIYQYANLKDLTKIALVNKFSFQVANQLFPQRFLQKHFPTKILKLFTPKQKTNIHFLPYKESFMGYDYLDGVMVEDLDEVNPNKSIFMGVDKYNRSFISLKLDIVIGKQMIQDVLDNVTQIPNQQEFMDLVRNNNVKQAMIFRFVNTLFQRYRNNKETWCVGSWYNLMDFTNTRLYDMDLDIYREIIQSDKMIDFNTEEDSGMQYSVTLALPKKCDVNYDFLTKQYKINNLTGDLEKII